MNLSEEEIIIDVKEFINNIKEILNEGNNDLTKKVETDFYTLQVVLQGLLDLYNKEKETSHFLQSELDRVNAKILEEKEKNKELKRLDESNSQIIANMSTRHFHDREKIRNSISKDKIRQIKEESDKDNCYQYLNFYEKVTGLLEEE